jgi:hypothetical protein
LDLPIT